MKLKTLHVENFGPVSDATVDLRAINIFIGEQSVGKSTLAKLITIFTDYISLCKLIHGGIQLWEVQLKEYNLDIYQNDSYRISYRMKEADKEFSISIQPQKISFSMSVGNKTIIEPGKIVGHLIELKKFYHEDTLTKAYQAVTKENKDNLLAIFTNSLYIPAERIIYSVLTNLMPALALANSTIPKNLLRFMVELNNAKAEYPSLKISLLDVIFKHEGSEDYIIFNPEAKNEVEREKELEGKKIPIAAASSGIQSLVPLLLVLHYAVDKREYSSFVIEEPECNLFPSKQVELLKDIIRLVKHPTRTLTITTHSPYLLSAMNNILFAGMLIEKYGEKIKDSVEAIVPCGFHLNASDCSVYSLGKDINGGEYCRSIMDEETGMIDFNSLDEASEKLSDEFERLQRAVLNFKSDD